MADAVTPHSWSLDHKELLCVLARFLKVADSTDHQATLFNGAERVLCLVFADEAGRTGVTPWLTYPGVRRMLHGIRKSQHEAWSAVFLRTDFADPTGAWHDHCERLVAAAGVLGIRLILRKRDHMKHAQAIRLFKKSQDKDRIEPHQGSRTTSKPKRSSSATFRQRSTRSAKERTEREYDHYHHGMREAVARMLAFRVSTPNSQGIHSASDIFSGSHTGSCTDPLPLRSSQQYKEGAYNQLSGRKVPTPFISIRTDSVTAIWHLLFEGKDGPASLTIMSMGKIAKPTEPVSRLTPATGIIRYLESYQGTVYRERGLTQGSTEQRLAGQKPYPYRPKTEWLVWERIGADAIIAVKSAEELRHFLHTNPAIDEELHISHLQNLEDGRQAHSFVDSLKLRLCRRVGQAVGALLNFLGLERTQALRFAVTMVSTWKIKAFHQVPKVSSARKRRSNVQRSPRSPTFNLKQYQSGVSTGYTRGAPSPRQPIITTAKRDSSAFTDEKHPIGAILLDTEDEGDAIEEREDWEMEAETERETDDETDICLMGYAED